MNAVLRRSVLASLFALGLAAPALAERFAAPSSEVLLTITGAIAERNVGDALQLDRDQLSALPQTSFTTSTTWTSGTPTFTGVLLKDLVAAIGASGGTITLTASNDYSVTMPLADAGDEAPLLAILMDGKPMSLRDKGPVWMVYPYDAGEDFRTEQALSRSVWQLTTLDFAE